jgi:hypothetical protein
MTGRALPSTREAERLTVREAHVAARDSGRIGFPAAKLGSNKGFVVPSKCAFLLFVFTSLSLRTTYPAE